LLLQVEAVPGDSKSSVWGKKQWIVLWFSAKKSVNHWIFPLDLDLPFALPPLLPPLPLLEELEMETTINYLRENCVLPAIA
jgi:hypothetical protein